MQLSAWLDGELAPEDRREIDALLQRDAEVRAMLEELRATVDAVRQLPRAKASGRLMESLRGQMERESLLGAAPPQVQVRSGGRLYLRWLATAAVLALTTTAAYLMWPKEPGGMMIAQNDPRTEPVGRGDNKGPFPPKPEALNLPAGPGREVRPAPEVDDAGSSVDALAKGAPGSRDKPFADVAVPAGQEAPAGAMGEPAIALGASNTGRDDRYLSQADHGLLHGFVAQAEARTGGSFDPDGSSDGDDDVPEGVTVVELAFADARDRQEATERLTARFAFKPAPASTSIVPTTFARAVADDAAAERLVAEIRASVASADSIHVLAARPSHEHADMARAQARMRAALERKFGSPPQVVEQAETAAPAEGRKAGMLEWLHKLNAVPADAVTPPSAEPADRFQPDGAKDEAVPPATRTGDQPAAAGPSPRPVAVRASRGHDAAPEERAAAPQQPSAELRPAQPGGWGGGPASRPRLVPNRRATTQEEPAAPAATAKPEDVPPPPARMEAPTESQPAVGREPQPGRPVTSKPREAGRSLGTRAAQGAGIQPVTTGPAPVSLHRVRLYLVITPPVTKAPQATQPSAP